jgi:hypothetical protein
VRNNDPAFTPCNELRGILSEQVGLIDERIATLSKSRTILAGFATPCVDACRAALPDGRSAAAFVRERNVAR